MKTFNQFIREQLKGYIPKDLHRRTLQQTDKGINPDNPDRMNIDMQFKDPQQRVPKIDRKIAPFAPDENLPPKVNSAPKGVPSTGRKLKNILPGGKIA